MLIQLTVRYPPPTMLYSMKTADGHKLMNQTALEAWLLDLTAKNKFVLRRQFSGFVQDCLQSNHKASLVCFLHLKSYCIRAQQSG